MNWLIQAGFWVGKKLFSSNDKVVIEAQTAVWKELIEQKDRQIERIEKAKELSNGEKNDLQKELEEERATMTMLLKKYENVASENWKLKEEILALKRDNLKLRQQSKRSMYE